MFKTKQRKTSIGIAVCRRHPVDRTPQLLLVKSRVTYNYCNFVFGKYKLWDTDRLEAMVGAMTQPEKLLVWSCDFAKMWYHVWLRVPNLEDASDTFVQFFINSRSKFERFIKDGGRRVRQMLSRTGSTELKWDIPKGRQNTEETELDCAKREIHEETGMVETDYTVLYNVKPICTSHEDDNVTYVHKYYVAWTDRVLVPAINYNNLTQVTEISDMQWMGLREINQLGQTDNLAHRARLALKLYKKNVSAFEFKDEIELVECAD